jgi:hypothetical protein
MTAQTRASAYQRVRAEFGALLDAEAKAADAQAAYHHARVRNWRENNEASEEALFEAMARFEQAKSQAKMAGEDYELALSILADHLPSDAPAAS